MFPKAISFFITFLVWDICMFTVESPCKLNWHAFCLKVASELYESLQFWSCHQYGFHHLNVSFFIYFSVLLWISQKFNVVLFVEICDNFKEVSFTLIVLICNKKPSICEWRVIVQLLCITTLYTLYNCITTLYQEWSSIK